MASERGGTLIRSNWFGIPNRLSHTLNVFLWSCLCRRDV